MKMILVWGKCHIQLIPGQKQIFLWDKYTGATGTHWPSTAANNNYPASLGGTGDHDMVITVNTNNTNIHWNLDPGGSASGKWDFTTALTHEIAHGLGFYTSVEQTLSYPLDLNKLGLYPTIYDQYINDGSSCGGTTNLVSLWTGVPSFTSNFQNFCQGLGSYGSCGSSNNVYFNGNLLFTPNPWIVATAVNNMVDPCGPRGPSFAVINITLVNIANPEISYSYTYDGSTNAVSVDIHNISTGIYAVNILSADGESASSTLEVD